MPICVASGEHVHKIGALLLRTRLYVDVFFSGLLSG
jgi:hypothetical protein